MQKALIYEAIFIVNRGIDDAASALERLKNNREAKDAGLSPAFLDQKLIEFEMHRASLNGYFTNHLDSAEEAHASELHKNYKQYRRKDLDEVQVYQDVELLEQRRWMEGKGPRVRFLSKEELRVHEGLPPKPNPYTEVTAASSRNTMIKKGRSRKAMPTSRTSSNDDERKKIQKKIERTYDKLRNNAGVDDSV